MTRSVEELSQVPVGEWSADEASSLLRQLKELRRQRDIAMWATDIAGDVVLRDATGHERSYRAGINLQWPPPVIWLPLKFERPEAAVLPEVPPTFRPYERCFRWRGRYRAWDNARIYEELLDER